MVPNGWEVKPLSSITKWSSGGTPSKNNPDYWSGEIPWISAASMRGHYFNKSEQKITDLAVSNGAKMAPKDSLLLLVRGSMLWNKIPVGIAARRVSFNQDVKCLIPHADELTTEFLLYWFLTYEHRLMNMVTGTGIGAGKLDTTDLQGLDVFLPPLPEQRKIAKILSTWDRGIAITEKLIDASKQQKKALMQQLLTGKNRLIDPETGKAFEGEWEEFRLSTLSIKGKDNFTDGDWIESPYIADSGCRLIQTGNIGVGCFKNKAKKYISEASFVQLKCKEVKVNDLLICRLAEPAGRACVVPDIGERKMLTSVDVTIMRVDKTKSSPEYLRYFFSLDHTLYTVTTLCGGSTRSRISRTNLGRMKILLPALNEQQKIVSVLTSADKEIELLEAKLAHFKQEKKALMQQLLTGKRRVKVDEVA